MSLSVAENVSQRRKSRDQGQRAHPITDDVQKKIRRNRDYEPETPVRHHFQQQLGDRFEELAIFIDGDTIGVYKTFNEFLMNDIQPRILTYSEHSGVMQSSIASMACHNIGQVDDG